MKYLQSAATPLVLFALMMGGASAQPIGAQARKLAEFGNISAEGEMACLDRLAQALAETPDARAYLIRYSGRDFPVGLFLRGLYGYRDYLVKSRGIEPGRISVVAGGNKDKIKTELWLVPGGAAAPEADSKLTFFATTALKFDAFFPDCPSEVSIHLEELNDHLRLYAEALRGNPNAGSRIVVYPGGRGGLRQAEKTARDTRTLLIKKYGVSAARIVAQARKRRRRCSEIELWVVPAGRVAATATPD